MTDVVSLPETNTTQDRSKSEPQHHDIVHLWEFLFELLVDKRCGSIITWITEENREFKFKDPEKVAKLWGTYKGVKRMNYEKLSRALRMYYSKGIIVKIPGQRLAYRFGKLPYKYEPGVTRSRHGHRIRACIKRHMPQHSSSSCQIKPCPLSWSFSPVITRLRKSCSWPLIPKPSYSISWYPAPAPNPPPISDCSKSKIIFPLFKASSFQGSENEVVYAADLKTSSSLSTPLQQRVPGATSMAVPVIKWI